jgi:UDP-N-acetylenolpyruvoylglucosamine reductase
VLVNHGGATCQHILELSDFIMTSVRDKFGIALRREPELF